jgi:mono/diheme cytochrome c family protein
MKEEQKKAIHEKYQRALQKGERFWPDSIYKDLLVSLAIFIILILLATFVGVPGEPKADPSDSSYVPKPEWYFLFLFKFLAIYGQIPLLGKIEWIATAVIPGLAVLLLVLLPFIDRNPYRHYSRRVLALTVMGIFVVTMVVLTLLANIPTTSDETGMTTMTLLQFLAGLILPVVTFLFLFGVAFLGKKNLQTTSRAQLGVAGGSALLMVALAVFVIASSPAPAPTETAVAGTLAEQIIAGQDIYSLNCVECHGADGEGGTIQGVEGLDGFNMKAIHSQDEMYTRNDATLAEIVSYGQPDLGMPPFGKAFGGAFSLSDIDSLVAFMRYSWDDRAEMPAEAVSSIPALAADEIPSWEVHIQPLVKRYCISCHKAGKQNNNYLLTSYDEMLNSGDNAPLITAGDANSLLLSLITGHEGTDPVTGKTIRQMPPTKLLDQKYIDMLMLWVMSGMPQTADDAAAASPAPTPSPTP